MEQGGGCHPGRHESWLDFVEFEVPVGLSGWNAAGQAWGHSIPAPGCFLLSSQAAPDLPYHKLDSDVDPW